MFGFKSGYISKWGGYLKSCEIGIYPDGIFRYLDISGRKMEFNIKDVSSITLNQGESTGESIVTINGSGTTLAATSGLPAWWARSLKEWIENTIREYQPVNKESDASKAPALDAFAKLKKLKELKDLGAISDEEYNAKHEKLLELI